MDTTNRNQSSPAGRTASLPPPPLSPFDPGASVASSNELGINANDRTQRLAPMQFGDESESQAEEVDKEDSDAEIDDNGNMLREPRSKRRRKCNDPFRDGYFCCRIQRYVRVDFEGGPSVVTLEGRSTDNPEGDIDIRLGFKKNAKITATGIFPVLNQFAVFVVEKMDIPGGSLVHVVVRHITPPPAVPRCKEVSDLMTKAGTPTVVGRGQCRPGAFKDVLERAGRKQISGSMVGKLSDPSAMQFARCVTHALWHSPDYYSFVSTSLWPHKWPVFYSCPTSELRLFVADLRDIPVAYAFQYPSFVDKFDLPPLEFTEIQQFCVANGIRLPTGHKAAADIYHELATEHGEFAEAGIAFGPAATGQLENLVKTHPKSLGRVGDFVALSRWHDDVYCAAWFFLNVLTHGQRPIEYLNVKMEPLDRQRRHTAIDFDDDDVYQRCVFAAPDVHTASAYRLIINEPVHLLKDLTRRTFVSNTHTPMDGIVLVGYEKVSARQFRRLYELCKTVNIKRVILCGDEDMHILPHCAFSAALVPVFEKHNLLKRLVPRSSPESSDEELFEWFARAVEKYISPDDVAKHLDYIKSKRPTIVTSRSQHVYGLSDDFLDNHRLFETGDYVVHPLLDKTCRLERIKGIESHKDNSGVSSFRLADPVMYTTHPGDRQYCPIQSRPRSARVLVTSEIGYWGIPATTIVLIVWRTAESAEDGDDGTGWQRTDLERIRQCCKPGTRFIVIGTTSDFTSILLSRAAQRSKATKSMSYADLDKMCTIFCNVEKQF